MPVIFATISPMHTVIIGGGFAGVKAALELSKARLGKITLISDTPYFLHHASLYQMAAGKNVATSAISLEDIFATHHDVAILHDTMMSIDLIRKRVACKKETISYDALIIAIGSVADYFGAADVKKHSHGASILEQARRFKHRVHDDAASSHHSAAYAIIGGGLTGTELAGALGAYLRDVARSHKTTSEALVVTVVEKAGRLLADESKSASKKVAARLRSLGVEVKTGHAMQPLAKEFVTVGKKKVPTRNVIWATGSHGNPYFAKQPHDFALSKGGRVIVNHFLEVHDDVYVIGDNAATPFSGHAQTAINQGAFVARHLKRKALGKTLKFYRPKPIMLSIPVGKKWTYVEKYGIYAAGKTGYFIHRLSELQQLKALLPRTQAVSVWRALYDGRHDCELCNV